MSQIRRPGKQAPEAAPVPERDRRAAQRPHHLPRLLHVQQPHVLQEPEPEALQLLRHPGRVLQPRRPERRLQLRPRVGRRGRADVQASRERGRGQNARRPHLRICAFGLNFAAVICR